MRSGAGMRDCPPIYWIGHSTRSIEGFVDLLRPQSVELLVDIRSVPRWSSNPQYNLDALPSQLSRFQAGHQRIAELGASARSRQISTRR
jgi:uncharacterized protein (DUF488 family)